MTATKVKTSQLRAKRLCAGSNRYTVHSDYYTNGKSMEYIGAVWSEPNLAIVGSTKRRWWGKAIGGDAVGPFNTLKDASAALVE